VTNYEFNWCAIPLLVVALAGVVVGVIVLHRERYSKVSWSLLAINLAIALWCGASAGMYFAVDSATALTWARYAYIAVPFLPTSLYFYASIALRSYGRNRLLLVILVLVSGVFTGLASQGTILISGIEAHWWGYYPVYGIAGPFFVAFYVVVIGLGILQFARAFRKMPRGSRFRRRIGATLIAMGVLMLSCVDFPAKMGVDLYPFAYLPAMVFLVMTLIIESRYRVVYMTPALAAEKILATVQSSILVTTPEGGIELGNAACGRLLGYSSTELTNLSMDHILSPALPWPQLLHECISSSGDVLCDREMVWLSRDGEAKHVSVLASVVREDDGRPLVVVLAAMDISDRKRSEAELRRYAARLESVNDLNRDILLADSPATIAQVALDHLADRIPDAQASVVAYDFEADSLSVLARNAGGGASIWSGGGSRLSAFDVTKIVAGGTDVTHVDELSALADPVHARERLQAEGVDADDVASYLRVHLVAKDECIGALNVASRRIGAFGPREIEMAQEVSGALTIGLVESAGRESLKRAEARYRTLFECVPVGLFSTDRDGNLVEVNPELCRIIGLDDCRAALGRNVFALWEGEKGATFRRLLEQEGVVYDFELKLQGPGESERYLQIDCQAVGDEEGQIATLQGSVRDVTASKRAEAQLAHGALHDALTGLPNRAFFLERLRHAISFGGRHADYRFAVLFLDCDRFKVINDSLGHVEGDRLLVAMGERLQACLRQVDAVARLGGDEFAILLDDICEVEDAVMVAERILASLQELFVLKGHKFVVTVSIGIAFGDAKSANPEDVIRDADMAMYRAKTSGRARFEVFDTAMHIRAVESLLLETDLRYALSRGEFCLHYQPIVSLKSGVITCFEALVRWKHPRKGLLAPDDFLPMAEDAGLTPALGEWVLREACAQARVWNEMSPSPEGIGVGVNISDRQFCQPGLDVKVAAILEESGLDPSRLHLEITEGAMMGDVASTQAILDRLKALGVRLHIDNFGMGFSSLNVLRRFPLDTVKMDRSFVAGLEGDVEVINAVVSLAHALHMQVVAGGVETGGQLAQLRSLACEQAQGYLFSRPLTARAARLLLIGAVPWAISASAESEDASTAHGTVEEV
jgi:diguanylate cyclase (GGDEF)-like protein/PAS domain S-box-containing protein